MWIFGSKGDVIMRKSIVLYVLLMSSIGFSVISYALRLSNVPKSELFIELPDNWKFGLRGKLRDRVTKKYIPKYEDMFMWSQMLIITHWFKDNDPNYDIKRRLNREIMKIKDQCTLFSFLNDPVSLASPGAIAQYSCPKNMKEYHGQMGILAFFQGKNGLYEVHWKWQGAFFEPPKGQYSEASKIPLPVSERELKDWYRFYAKIKVEKVQ